MAGKLKIAADIGRRVKLSRVVITKGKKVFKAGTLLWVHAVKRGQWPYLLCHRNGKAACWAGRDAFYFDSPPK